ncbi:MAG: zinc-binding dehydrogenase [Fidelibacterota bacterium]|nr:MAG: zinc-binding dehydrogenase [Candidatus Neomarinimicrobiota bacterium]
MPSRFTLYQSAKEPVPLKTWAWNLYGPGVENIGRDGKPEIIEIPQSSADQLLVRIDTVGLCFSDVKLIQQGGSHPKLCNRNLARNPTRLGHEVSLTVIKVGKKLKTQFSPGQRYTIQPDIHQQGKSTAYGYTIPGGLCQFHLIGPEILSADAGSYLLPVSEGLSYAEVALTEPWACVEAAYTQRRRLLPKAGGTMWILGNPDDVTDYMFSSGLEAPTTIVATDIPASLMNLIVKEIDAASVSLIERNGLTTKNYPILCDEFTNGLGFDDIVLLNPRSSRTVSEAIKLTARRGTFNIVGHTALDGPVTVDVGRIHYDYIAYIGTHGPDIAASYGETRNRCELRAGGTALFVGAGGPMGQMHVQRAIELADGPTQILATDINPMRLKTIEERFTALAEENGKRLAAFNPETADETLYDFVMRRTNLHGADDVIVSVPSAELMAESACVMKPDGMLVLFAGVPNGTVAPLDMSPVYLQNAQFTGTSGSKIADQENIIHQALNRRLSPIRSVAAIGGLDAALDGIHAMIEGRFPGKIVIFPQLRDLPLIGLTDLKVRLPDIAPYLAPGDVWTADAEQVLIEKYWTP